MQTIAPAIASNWLFNLPIVINIDHDVDVAISLAKTLVQIATKQVLYLPIDAIYHTKWHKIYEKIRLIFFSENCDQI